MCAHAQTCQDHHFVPDIGTRDTGTRQDAYVSATSCIRLFPVHPVIAVPCVSLKIHFMIMIYLLQIYAAVNKSPRFTEFHFPPAVALGGLDQMIRTFPTPGLKCQMGQGRSLLSHVTW